MSRELLRCDDCVGECDGPYRKAAIELLLLDDGTQAGLEKAEKREALLKARLRNIIGCGLSSHQISENLDRLTAVEDDADGR